ncbi:MAG: 4Fe-4S binding protein, partial [Pseudomonadota bacterium]
MLRALARSTGAFLAGIVAFALAAEAETVSPERLAELVVPPYALGEAVNDEGVYHLLNSGGAEAGYVFQTEPLAPLPGFSGSPINVMVTVDLEGKFIDVRLLDHNEPIFVSGLGQAPFHKFFEQYGGHSIATSMVVGTPYGEGGDGGALVYLDGVTKATASVRIAHESLLAATLAVVKERLQGVAVGPPAPPDPHHEEDRSGGDHVEPGIATRLTVTTAQLLAAFAGTVWEDDDPEALDDPEGVFLDLWIVDVGPKSVARAALSEDTFEELQQFLSISTHDEPILVIDAGRHGLVSPDFIRNTSPDWLSASQDGLPVALRDADLFVEVADDAPEGEAMILRTDRRLGFDPTREWTLAVLALREHGMFQPEIGSATFEAAHVTDERFFTRPVARTPTPPWVDAILNRQADLIALALFLAALVAVLAFSMRRFAAMPGFTPARLGILAAMTIFVGWWGQGQLSIVTPLAALQTALSRGAFDFLLYDPFSLLIWGVVIVSFVLWGRGFFCGWLCPFGALQEFANWIGKALRLPQIEPSAVWDARLRPLKYVVLAALVGVAVFAPAQIDAAAEVEPFKTAITVYFVREWEYVAYAVFWLLLSMTLFKGFCRYVCPLGALMAVGGVLRGRDW